MFDVYVESGIGGHIDNATQAWMFDLDHWGTCGQGDDEAAALADLARRALVASMTVVERIAGDEQAFERDRVPETQAELACTQEILDASRAETIELITQADDAELDYDDPERILPDWATWRTPRQLAWHIADTESRYYLAALRVEPPPRASDLELELRYSAEHVRVTLTTLPPRSRHRTRRRIMDDDQSPASPRLARTGRTPRAPTTPGKARDQPPDE